VHLNIQGFTKEHVMFVLAPGFNLSCRGPMSLGTGTQTSLGSSLFGQSAAGSGKNCVLFCHTCVMKALQRFFIHSFIYLLILINLI